MFISLFEYTAALKKCKRPVLDRLNQLFLQRKLHSSYGLDPVKTGYRTVNILKTGKSLPAEQNVELIISNYQNYQLNQNIKSCCSNFKLKPENLFTIQFLCETGRYIHKCGYICNGNKYLRPYTIQWIHKLTAEKDSVNSLWTTKWLLNFCAILLPFGKHSDIKT